LPRYSDLTSIAATTSGVSANITTQYNAHLRKLRLSFTQAATADLPQVIELTWAGSPSPLRFVPNAVSFVAGTPVGGQADFKADADGMIIPLDVIMDKADVCTIKITSTGNLTVKVSLEWD
jgi:hypothetical protein